MSDSTKETKQKILESAKKEFLEKGFSAASLRTIASNAGLTTGAMYRHFKDKDALFCALVDDAVDFIIKAISSTGLDFHKHELNPVGKEHSAHEKEAISAIVDYIYSDFDAFTLLLTKSAGSTHENFLQEICDLYTKNVMIILDWMKSQNLIKNKIDPMTVHVTATTFITSVAEIVYHKMPREEAEVFLDNMQAFFHFGYMHMMGVNCSEE